MEDLWPDFKEFSPEKTPISIIKEHASKLYEKTDYGILAEVEKYERLRQIPLFENDKVIGFVTPPFQYNFYIKAQALNYQYKLFKIGHDIYLYPIYFFGIDKDILDELFPNQEGFITIGNETELLSFLKNIFSAKKTLKIIHALISQLS